MTYGIIDPDYARAYTVIRKLAWEEGYAIGLHGSFTRDLDLIAVPWAGGRPVCEPEHLIRRIVAADILGLREQHGNPGIKPHGRKVWTLLFTAFSDPRFIDLSIMPRCEWLPIAGAPRDGTHILAIAVDESAGFGWPVPGGPKVHAQTVVHWHEDAFWPSVCLDGDKAQPFAATHWLPLRAFP